MEKIELFCDICEKPLTQNIRAATPTDGVLEYQQHRVYTTLKFDTKKIFPHLCARCAKKLDYMYEKLQEQEKKKVELVANRTELNEKRKRIFNTKG